MAYFFSYIFFISISYLYIFFTQVPQTSVESDSAKLIQTLSSSDDLRSGRDSGNNSSTANLLNDAEQNPFIISANHPSGTPNIKFTDSLPSTSRPCPQSRSFINSGRSMSMIVHPGSVRRNYEPVQQEMENCTSVPTTPVPSVSIANITLPVNNFILEFICKGTGHF